MIATYFFTVQWYSLLVIIFSIKHENRLVQQVSSRNSIMMNLENFVPASISESESEKFLVFYLNLPCDFFIMTMLYYLQQNPVTTGNLPRVLNPFTRIHLTVYSWRESTLITFLYWGSEPPNRRLNMKQWSKLRFLRLDSSTFKITKGSTLDHHMIRLWNIVRLNCIGARA